MRILFLDAYFEPEQIAFTHLENDLLEGLVGAGHEVEVVCPIPTRGISAEVAKDYKNRKSETLYNGHVHVTRFSAPQEKKNPLIRALRYFWCNLRTYQIGKKAKDVDVVFANSTPPTQGWIAGIVAKKLKIPFIYSLQDIFPDSLINAGMAKEGSLIWKIGRTIEDKTYSYATRIITISEDFQKNIELKGVNPTKICIIPNWINTDSVFPVSRENNKLFEKYNLDRRKYYICYSGNIGHSQNLELLVESALTLETNYPDIAFVIIGEGAAKDKLHSLIEERSIQNITLLPFQPYTDIAEVFSLGDVGLIISKPGIGGSSVPSKTWSIMAAQKPVLCSFDEDSELSRIVKKINCGIVVPAGNKEELMNAIIHLKKDEDNVFGINGYNYVKEVMNLNKCVRNYISLLTTHNGD